MRFFRLLFALFLVFIFLPDAFAAPAEHAIIISFDGLRPDAITRLGEKGAPHFYHMMKNGAYTFNARTDPDWTVTMPNHTCMITGRGVEGKDGHNYTDNSSALSSIQEHKGSYVAGIFDVAKEHGLSTGFFVSKLKFKVFLNSYGKNIDSAFVSDQQDMKTLERFLLQASRKLPNLTFIHFSGPDFAGHHHGWSLDKGSAYLAAVQKEDAYLGRIMDMLTDHAELLNSTVIWITSDHGGSGMNHADIHRVEDYRVPLIIWGKDVATGVDLYKINMGIRKDPGDRQVPYAEALQPIRNGDVANGALKALGLPPVPGSTIGNPEAVRSSPEQ